jgi:alpha-ketoglutarate-dependent taurine dioxygenase
MSLEQLLMLAGQLAQSPRLPTAGAQTVRASTVSASARLSAEELEALREVWSTPLRPNPTGSAPPLLH